MLDKQTSADEELAFLPIMISYCKFCGQDVAGFLSRKQQLLGEQYGVEFNITAVFAESSTVKFVKIFEKYFDSVSKALLTMHRKYQRMQKLNKKDMELKGELSKEREQETDEMTKSCDTKLCPFLFYL